MERHADDLAEAGAAARENTLQRLRAFPTDADLSEFRQINETLGQTIDEARASLGELRTAVASLRANNLQQAVMRWQTATLRSSTGYFASSTRCGNTFEMP